MKPFVHSYFVWGQKTDGAPLICVHEDVRRNGNEKRFHYTQHGLLAWTSDRIQTLYIFANVTDYRYWIEKSIKKYNV